MTPRDRHVVVTPSVSRVTMTDRLELEIRRDPRAAAMSGLRVAVIMIEPRRIMTRNALQEMRGPVVPLAAITEIAARRERASKNVESVDAVTGAPDKDVVAAERIVRTRHRSVADARMARTAADAADATTEITVRIARETQATIERIERIGTIARNARAADAATIIAAEAEVTAIAGMDRQETMNPAAAYRLREARDESGNASIAHGRENR